MTDDAMGRVLQLVAEGRLTADEAGPILDALDIADAVDAPTTRTHQPARVGAARDARRRRHRRPGHPHRDQRPRSQGDPPTGPAGPRPGGPRSHPGPLRRHGRARPRGDRLGHQGPDRRPSTTMATASGSSSSRSRRPHMTATDPIQPARPTFDRGPRVRLRPDRRPPGRGRRSRARREGPRHGLVRGCATASGIASIALGRARGERRSTRSLADVSRPARRP